MSSFQAVALYDFSTKINGELSFCAGDVVSVLSTNVGNGWWQAKNSEEKVGLIPQSYFKIETDSGSRLVRRPPSPPKIPSSSSSSSSSDRSLPPRPPPKPRRTLLNRDLPSLPTSPQSSHPLPLKLSPIHVTTDSDNEASNNEGAEEVEESTKEDDKNCTTLELSAFNSYYDTEDDDDDDDDEEEEYYKSNKLIGFTTGSADLYLFDMNPSPVPEDVHKVSIFDSYEGPVWSFDCPNLICRVGSPKKEKKFRGMKSFISYEITPSTTNIPVCRRYKHFDWLHRQLVGKFSTLVIPPLPAKQISGRFEEDFINTRLKQLELWLARMCKHSVISRSDVFQLFINCTDPEQWKAGKRQAERDKFKGAFFFYTIETPGISLDPIAVEIQLDKFARFIRCIDDSMRHLLGVCQKVGTGYKFKFKKEFYKLGKSFEGLSKSFELDSRSGDAKKLSSALLYTGKTFTEVGMLFCVQPSRDLEPLQEGFIEYKGILSVIPDVLLVQRSTTNKIQETAGHLCRADVDRVQARADVITYSVLAEMHHFQINRTSDFSVLMQNYLQAQIEFFKKITSKFEQALKHYDGIS